MGANGHPNCNVYSFAQPAFIEYLLFFTVLKELTVTVLKELAVGIVREMFISTDLDRGRVFLFPFHLLIPWFVGLLSTGAEWIMKKLTCLST